MSETLAFEVKADDTLEVSIAAPPMVRLEAEAGPAEITDDVDVWVVDELVEVVWAA